MAGRVRQDTDHNETTHGANPNSRQGPTYRKRRRIALACDSCRERKVRCNGVKPVCEGCQRRGLPESQCVHSTIVENARSYSERESVQSTRCFPDLVLFRYIKSLHDRIRRLEDSRSHRAHVNTEQDPSSSPSARLSSAHSEAIQEHSAFDPPQENVSPRQLAPDTQTSSLVDPSINEQVSQPVKCTNVSDTERTGHISYVGVPASVVVPDTRIHQHARASDTPSTSCGGASENAQSLQSHWATDPGDDGSPVNAMGAVPSIAVQLPDPREEFYGQSSVVSLLHQVHQATSYNAVHEQNPQSSRLSSSTNSRRRDSVLTQANTSSLPRMNHFPLPARALADHLLDLYWSNVHLFYPWVHTQSFLAAYRRLWTTEGEQTGDLADLPNVGLGGRNCPTAAFHCALNAMFALGCEFSTSSPDERELSTITFVDRVQRLLQIDLLDNGDLSIVQTLLLVAQYLQCTQYPTRCWAVVGLACRIAQGLGMHLNYPAAKYSSLELEMRRRVWHGCMLLDR